ncbi:MAG: class I SAM-dependent methyltransferase [Verrucomicrobiae bacterium]|nr:class I SAM-dependent methyltransferase [Verrucomicrobiae bacterium]
MAVIHAHFDREQVFNLARARNYLCHRQAHHALRSFLRRSFSRPLHLLDLGCGDAREIAATLRNLPVAHYTGVDTSSPKLTRARQHLSRLACPCNLVAADALEYLRHSREPVDVIWMGLFLHHFSRPLKRELFGLARQILRPGGCLLAHDPLPREDESRQDYLRRLAGVCRRQWVALSPADRRSLYRHWSRHGRHERFSVLSRMAQQAGFCQGSLLFRDNQELYALTLFPLPSAPSLP